VLAADLDENVKLLDDMPVQQPLLRAYNCVYHDLAQKHAQICEFDLALMSTSLGEQVSQSRCMAKGDMLCEFTIRPLSS
jgi:predicted ArsR family transcriptional regulator